jgi:hypothetical protein
MQAERLVAVTVCIGHTTVTIVQVVSSSAYRSLQQCALHAYTHAMYAATALLVRRSLKLLRLHSLLLVTLCGTCLYAVTVVVTEL